MELNLRFANAQQVVVTLEGEESGVIAFTSPFTDEDLQELRWYLETYAAAYITDIDDDRAGRLVGRLKHWGIALFEAVFQGRGANRLLDRFLDDQEAGRVLTISATQPEISALPWELLHLPGGAYVFNEDIAIRRDLPGERGGRSPDVSSPKAQLHLLFVVSRPHDAGFIDPRSEGIAVMDALEQVSRGRVTVEFLRPATLEQLRKRLQDNRLPAVDILHFDGHGVFDATEGKNLGYLLFEQEDGNRDLVSAELLGQLLNRKKLGLVVLSACQSAMTAGEEAIGSVAARLMLTGVPSVVAMSYSVLVNTTQRLFEEFYEQLVQGRGVGESLDNARRRLMNQPERGERQRGQDRVMLRLADWFVPTLYQAGQSRGLVRPDGAEPAQRETWSNLPQVPESGFWGRQRELWEIERAFVTHSGKGNLRETRRLTIAGFGGQGKTALAQEAGRWLLQTRMFDAVCFVDYAAFQGVDAVALAVSTVGVVLQESLIDALAVTRVLQERSTLIILDNLETLSEATLQDLLTVAKGWSEAGQSRVLLTTRQMVGMHPDYPSQGSHRHQLVPLHGLGSERYPQASIDYFQALMALPPVPQVPLPGRSALVALFKLVDFHPLSINLIAEQLRSRRVAEVGQALERLLAEVPEGQEKDKSLIASLNLSLERLDVQAQDWVLRLGVFAGGALEPVLLEITELTAEQWQRLRQQLMAAGLLQMELMPEITLSEETVYHLKFHPTLAAVLWQRLSETEQAELQQRHRKQYFGLAGWLYTADSQTPHATRATAVRELPNLLIAVRSAAAAGEEWGVVFAHLIDVFLDLFGMKRDRAELMVLAKAAAGAIDSETRLLALIHEGERLGGLGEHQAAAQIFQSVLQTLENSLSEERCRTLINLGRCNKNQGYLEQAVQWYDRALIELRQLEKSAQVMRQVGMVYADLGFVLTAMGQFELARQNYEMALAVAQNQDDNTLLGNIEGQLGTLALHEHNLPEAERRYREALSTFEFLNEPGTVSIYWHQLGRVYQESKQLKAAEQAYRESARIKEAQGNLLGAALTWHNLASVFQQAEKLLEAEEWYRKAIAGFQSVDNPFRKAGSLSNLATIVSSQPSRLSEARQLAEEALVIQQNLDPSAAQIWLTYGILADIATQQNDLAQSQDYQRMAQQAYDSYAGSQQVLQQSEEWIQAAVAALTDGEVQQLEEVLSQLEVGKLHSFVAAIRQIFVGERDEVRLCGLLNYKQALIVREILRRIR